MIQGRVGPATVGCGWAVRHALTAQPVSSSSNTTHRNSCCCFVNLNIAFNQSPPFDGAIFTKKLEATTRKLLAARLKGFCWGFGSQRGFAATASGGGRSARDGLSS